MRGVVERGWMQRLPDGSLHPDARVTRAAFYVVCSRLVADFGPSTNPTRLYRVDVAERGAQWLPGAEALKVLDELVALRKRDGG
jgi:hypothetical protein